MRDSKLRAGFPALLTLIVPLLWLGVAGQAHATLIGDTVTAEVLFGGAPSGQGPTSAVVGAGVEFNFGNVDIDVGASGAEYIMILGGTVVLDETYLLTDLDWTDLPGEIVGVVLNSFGGLSVAPVLGFGAHEVSVTLPGGTFVASGAFVDVTFNAVHIPEPNSVALFGISMLLVSGALRRRTT